LLRPCFSLCFLGLLLLPQSAAAQATLPYATRSLSFSGLSTTVRGDIRTVGMGGASDGLADTFIASLDNPAGLAMTVGIGDIHFASTTSQDGHVQSFDKELRTQSYGLALGIYPWALSVGYLSPYGEGASYGLISALTPGLNPIQLGVLTRELVFSAARVLLHNRLSFGVSLTLAQAERFINAPAAQGGNHAFASYTAGVTAGGMYQLPKRVLLGLSFSSPLHFDGASAETQQKLIVPGFFQPVNVPWRVSLGLGFVPNRYFRADLTLHLFTETGHTALIRDEAALVGQRATIQPHLGAAYVFADYKEFKATLFLGTYYESTRIRDTSNRIHGTGGVEARIWIITVGGGVDVASNYRSYLLSVGVDVFGLMARIGMIPPFGTPAAGRMFPKPWSFTDLGLARPLVERWQPTRDLDPIAVGLGIPKNLGQGISNAAAEVKSFGHTVATAMAESNETPEDKVKQAHRAEEAAIALQAAHLVEAAKAEQRARVDALVAEGVRRALEAQRVAEEKRARRRRMRIHKLERAAHPLSPIP
jgi:hypothetical protein